MVREKLVELQKKVFDEYMRKTPKSKQMHDRACRTLVGGVSGNLRFFQPYPLYMTHGRGSKTYDVDRNEYIDCNLCAGALLLGHQYPEVIEEIRLQMGKGLLICNPDLLAECAELLVEIVPCAEKVRFLNTGTEAILTAVRFARAFTGKNKIIKFYGHYHGQDDQFLAGISHPSPEAVSSGVPKDALANTILLRYNDVDTLRRKLDEDNDIAGVILDLLMFSGGIWPPSHEYLKCLRRLTKERGVVLIFDEVITGFRLAPGGGQEYFGVTPDLAVVAKAMATGGKLAAVVGKEKIMNIVNPGVLGPFGGERKPVFQSGTVNDGTLALAAAIAALKVYKKLNEKGEYQRLFRLSEKLKTGIETAFSKRGVPCHINMLGPLLTLFLTDLEPHFEVYCNLDTTLPRLFLQSLISEGVWSYVGRKTMALSFAHTDEDIKRVLDAVNNSLEKVNFKRFYI